MARISKLSQYGGATQFPIYRGIRQQRGHGIGGLFRGLFRTVAPMLKKGLVHIGKRALTAGASALSDIDAGTPIKQAFKNRARVEMNALNPINRINAALNSSTNPRKRAASNSMKSRKRAVKTRRKTGYTKQTL